MLSAALDWWNGTMDSATLFGLTANQIRRLAAIGQFLAGCIIVVDLLGIKRFHALGALLQSWNRYFLAMQLRLKVFGAAAGGMISLLPAAVPGSPSPSLILQLEQDRRLLLARSLRRLRKYPWLAATYIASVIIPTACAWLSIMISQDNEASSLLSRFVIATLTSSVLAIILAMFFVPISIGLLARLIHLFFWITTFCAVLVPSFWLTHPHFKYSLLLISFCIFLVSSVFGIVFT